MTHDFILNDGQNSTEMVHIQSKPEDGTGQWKSKLHATNIRHCLQTEMNRLQLSQKNIETSDLTQQLYTEVVRRRARICNQNVYFHYGKRDREKEKYV